MTITAVRPAALSSRKRPVRAVLYLRISKADRAVSAAGLHLGYNTDAIDRQREECVAIIRQRGWVLVREYVDLSLSAMDKSKVRPDYDRMVTDFGAGDFDAIVCWDLDRLTRQPRQLEDWIDAATEKGLVIVTANGEADLGTDSGRLFARVKASVARSEVERKGARQKAANRQRAARGSVPKGTRLTGYGTDGVVIPAEAEAVAWAFSALIEGSTLKGIAAGMPIPTRRGGAWSASSIRGMLLNPRYAGIRTYLGEETAGAWEPVISAETYETAVAILTDPARRTQEGTARKHQGAGLYRCRECGRTVHTYTGRRYHCPDGHFTRSTAPLDNAVNAVVEELLLTLDLGSLLTPERAEKVRELDREARAVRARLTRFENDYAEGTITGGQLKAATDKASTRLEEVRARRAELAASSAPASVVGAADPVAAYRSAGLELRRKVIGALVTVKIGTAPRGRRAFDPNSITVSVLG